MARGEEDGNGGQHTRGELMQDDDGNQLYLLKRKLAFTEEAEPDANGDLPKTLKTKEVEFSYYKVSAPESYYSDLEGAADIFLTAYKNEHVTEGAGAFIETITDENGDAHDIEQENEFDKEIIEDKNRHEEIDFPFGERVFLILEEEVDANGAGTGNYITPKLVNPSGICNDCITQRPRGAWYKKDKLLHKYPMLVEVESLPYGLLERRACD